MKSLRVLVRKPYEIQIGRGLLGTVGSKVRSLKRDAEKALVMSDDNVFPLYGDRVIASLKDGGFAVQSFVVPAGEDAKSMDNFASALELMAKEGFKRSDVVIALGGGVVGDLAGFTASAYMRGIDVVQVPTTLLAMVDSSVGGKTAINLSVGKNMAGAFHQPALVVSDLNVLDTLNDNEIKCGMGELAKYAFLIGSDFASLLSREKPGENLEEIVFRSCLYKASIVEQDEKENGKRKLLNLGHTFGHAYERLSGFSISHGQCVAMGLFDAIDISRKMGKIHEENAADCRAFLEKLGFSSPTGFDKEKVTDCLFSDKKTLADGKLDFVTVCDMGRVEICSVDIEKLREFYI